MSIKYYLINSKMEIIKGITIDESAKEDFKSFMQWEESTWEASTRELKDGK